MLSTAVPAATPPLGWHAPGEYVAAVAALLPSAEPGGTSRQSDDASVIVVASSNVAHVSEYTEISAEHPPPTGAPHGHGEQLRVSSRPP
jgi:hypothetical protein